MLNHDGAISGDAGSHHEVAARGRAVQGHGERKQRWRALCQKIRNRRRSWHGHFHIRAAGKFSGTPEIHYLLRAGGERKEAVTGLDPLGIGGAIGRKELIESGRVGGTVGRGQLAAALLITGTRRPGRYYSP